MSKIMSNTERYAVVTQNIIFQTSAKPSNKATLIRGKSYCSAPPAVTDKLNN